MLALASPRVIQVSWVSGYYTWNKINKSVFINIWIRRYVETMPTKNKTIELFFVSNCPFGVAFILTGIRRVSVKLFSWNVLLREEPVHHEMLFLIFWQTFYSNVSLNSLHVCHAIHYLLLPFVLLWTYVHFYQVA